MRFNFFFHPIFKHIVRFYFLGKSVNEEPDRPKPKMRSIIHPTSHDNDDDECQSPVLVLPVGASEQDVSY